MIVDSNGKGFTKMKKYLVIFISLVSSVANPILLHVIYLVTLEKARKLAQNFEIDALNLLVKSRKIKKQFVNWFTIELGTKHKTFRHM